MSHSDELLIELERVRRTADQIYDRRSQQALRQYADDLGKQVVSECCRERRQVVI